MAAKLEINFAGTVAKILAELKSALWKGRTEELKRWNFKRKKICFVFLCGFPLLWGSDKPIQQFSFRPCVLYLFSITVKEKM